MPELLMSIFCPRAAQPSKFYRGGVLVLSGPRGCICGGWDNRIRKLGGSVALEAACLSVRELGGRAV